MNFSEGFQIDDLVYRYWILIQQIPSIELEWAPMLRTLAEPNIAPAVLSLVFLTFLILEARFPFIQFGRRVAANSYVTNIGLFVTNNIVLSIMSITALYLVAEQYSGFGLLNGIDLSFFDWILVLIIMDFSIFAWHFANHQIPLLWQFHKVHHSDKSMNVSTAIRFHIGELVLTIIYKSVLIILLGIPALAVAATEFLMAFFVMFHHMNISFRGEKSLSRIIIVPHLHRAHHSSKRIEHDSNYGGVLSLWDRCFGTLNETAPTEIGLQGIAEQNFLQAITFGLTADNPRTPKHENKVATPNSPIASVFYRRGRQSLGRFISGRLRTNPPKINENLSKTAIHNNHCTGNRELMENSGKVLIANPIDYCFSYFPAAAYARSWQDFSQMSSMAAKQMAASHTVFSSSFFSTLTFYSNYIEASKKLLSVGASNLKTIRETHKACMEKLDTLHY